MYIYNHLYKASFIEYIKLFLSHSRSVPLFLSFPLDKTAFNWHFVQEIIYDSLRDRL